MRYALASFLALTFLACAGNEAPELGTDEDVGAGPIDVGSVNDAGETEDSGAPSDSGMAPSGPPIVELIASGLSRPWGLDFLPDGRGLVTERSGSLRVLGVDGQLSEPLEGVPTVYAAGQGGLLDIVVGPDFASDSRIYFCYAALEGRASGTEVARAVFNETRLTNLEVIFRASPKTISGFNHYGCRLAFDGGGHLFIGVGERFNQLDQAQQLTSHLGKVMRIFPDGRVPPDNPFVERDDAQPEIWSYGHRNIQGMAIHPSTGQVWTHEHGPAGGDEINAPQAGQNYGWPEVSYGNHYDGRDIPDGHQSRGFTEPLHFWNPSIAPSGMMFYQGALFPEWRGQLFVGALAFQYLARLELDGEQVRMEHRLLREENQRIREVSEAPDGSIYVLTDSNDGRIYRIHR